MVTSYIFTVHTYWFAILWLFGLGLGLRPENAGLGLEASGLGLGLVPPGLVNITGYSMLKNVVTLKSGLKVTQGH